MSDHAAFKDEDLPQDEHLNNVLATGAVLGALMLSDTPTDAKVVYDDGGHATNELVVKFEFMRSPYRLTVERVTDEQVPE